MSNEPDPNDVRNLWQDQEVEKMTITIDEIRRRATRFERRIYWRNVREYAAGAVVLPVFALQARHAQGWGVVPPLLLIAGVIYVMVQLYRRGSARSVPADAGIQASLEFQRVELERQRDALRSVWTWYLLPLVPGFAATLVLGAFDHGINARLIIAGVALVLLLVAIWALNEWAARKLDRQIADVRRMETM